MKLKATYKTFLGLLLGATVLFFWKGYTIVPALMLVVGVASLIAPKVAGVIDAVVLKVIRLVGVCLSAVLLFLSYYSVLTPIALVARLLGRADFLGLQKPIESSFKTVEKNFDPESFEKMW